jgi:FkbM family methyltransferase
MIKKHIIKLLGKFRYEIRKKSFYEKKSYSQCGEDLIVDYIFGLRKYKYPTYIDIGANDPFFISNTALFYQKGCRGLNIEANPKLINKFDVHRPHDINLNIGVGKAEGLLDFYVMNEPTLSSFSMFECNEYIKTGKYNITEIIKIKVETLSYIIEKYCNGIFPDFMSLDAEGMDFEILKSIDFDLSSPKVICVEAAEYSPIGAGKRRDELIDFLVGKGYYEYANTNLNAIMVKKDFWFI